MTWMLPYGGGLKREVRERRADYVTACKSEASFPHTHSAACRLEDNFPQLLPV